jgi:hypothetical protein
MRVMMIKEQKKTNSVETTPAKGDKTDSKGEKLSKFVTIPHNLRM